MKPRAILVAAILMPLFLLGAVPAQAQQAVDASAVGETRSESWLLIVGIGLVLAAALAAYSVRVFVRSLPDRIADDARAALRKNGGLLAAGGGLFAVAAVFALAQMPDPVSVTTVVYPGEVASAGDPTGDGVGAVDASGTTTGATGDGTGNTAAADGAGAGGPGTTSAPIPVADVQLFDAANDRIGFTPDAIRICGHAPLSLGAALNTRTEDLVVFWRYLNDRGGVHGRRVEVTLEDDQYSASGGVPAAQRCAERDPFLIFGSVGSDVVPPVRQWAEEQRMLYLYGFSAATGTEDLRYSYTATISQEDTARVLADIATERFPGQDIALLWRNSSNIQPGRDAFRRQAERFGGNIVADLPVQQSQGNYTQEIIELQQAGAEVVVILDDALAQTNIMLQGTSQGYRPNWVVFSFNLQTDTLGDDALDPPLTGANLAPAYLYGESSGTFAPYAAEMREFEAAYARYSPSTDLSSPTGDIAWQTWIGFKGLASLLEACGPDCTRNRIAGMFEGGYVGPSGGVACPVDFSRDGHHGGVYIDLYETYERDDGTAAWRTYQRCAWPR